MLFTDIQRTDSSPRRPDESDFDFLERSAYSPIGTVRKLLEACLANYPVDEAKELVERLRCGDASNFASASFELLIHEYLRRLGMQITPHPLLPKGSLKRPDFLVECPGREKLYLEAICASDDKERHSPAEKRKATALQKLDEQSHPNFLVSVYSEGDPTTQPSGRQLAAEVIDWLNTLDPELMLELLRTGGLKALPEYKWRHEDWHVSVQPIPLKLDARGKQHRMIGIRSLGARWTDGFSPIRDAVMFKTNRYGDLDYPYIVAVNVDTFDLDPTDEVQALYGQEQVVVSRADPSQEPSLQRAANGAWIGPSGPRGRRASGAWFFNNLSPYSLAKKGHTLYIHPFANRAVPETFLMVPHVMLVEDELRCVGGKDIATVFDVPATWPQ